jgi:hypothetical protein
MTLTVTRKSHDTLLVTAIARGWSVASVRPAAERAPRTGTSQ